MPSLRSLPDVLAFVREHPECSGENIREGVDGGNSVIDQARRLLVERGEIFDGPRRGQAAEGLPSGG